MLGIGLGVSKQAVGAVYVGGDPNELGTSVYEGQVLVRSDNGWVYQGVLGGNFSGNDSLGLSSQMTLPHRPPLTASTTWLVEANVMTLPGVSFALLSDRLSNVGFAIIVSQAGAAQLSVRTTGLVGFTWDTPSVLEEGYVRFGLTIDHVTQTAHFVRNSESITRTTTVSNGGGVTAQSLSCGGTNMLMSYAARIPAYTPLETLQSWANWGCCAPDEGCDMRFDLTRSTRVGNLVANTGSITGNIGVVDNSPATWNQAVWKRIK